MPSACDLAEVSMGVVGTTRLRTCDTGGAQEQCTESLSITVTLFEEDPQLDGDRFTPGMRDPEIMPLDSVDSGGSFAFDLGPGTYYLCVEESDDLITCAAVTLTEADPLRSVYYETGNGSLWNGSSCD